MTKDSVCARARANRLMNIIRIEPVTGVNKVKYIKS